MTDDPELAELRLAVMSRAKLALAGSTYATGKPYPPESEWEPRVFVRDGSFYVISLAADDDLNLHAELNPGTLRIEDAAGTVLWPEGTKQ
ncbi:MAG TPA: hypothetical protein VFO80_13720 [Sphingomonas sp.]|nr:hypothetical protein [Sphingomonas sp.]